MSIELKQAAQQTLKAIEDLRGYRPDIDEAIEALRTAIQQATQTAEVTDEQIAACVKRASTYGLPFVGLLNPGGTPSDFSKRFTAEILSLRPEQVPMTDEQIADACNETQISRIMSFTKGVRTAEAHQGITAQVKKEST